MNVSQRFSSIRLYSVMLIGAAILLIPLVTYLIVLSGIEVVVRIGQIILFVVLTITILRQPYVGIVVTLSSLPVVEILPSIPYGTSAISLLGGVTLGSYLLKRFRRKTEVHLQHNGLLLGVLFVIWMSISNPVAAFLPSDDGRNWVFTFLQLLILAWLASCTLDNLHKQRVLMWMFSIATVFSALYALQQGEIGETIKDSVRSVGLVGGSNSAARYFVVSLVLMYYLRISIKSRILRLILLLGMGITLIGVMFTVSRTGLLLLVAALGMLFVQRVGSRRQIQVFILILLALVFTWFFADNILSIFRSIFPAIRQGTDTIGLRYGLWQAGWRMWLDQPIHGIGIGQFNEQLVYFGRDLLPADHLHLGAHNMYVQVLAETGLIGLMLFMSMFIVSMRSLWMAAHSDDVSKAHLAQIWFIVLALILLGGITKHDHYDKLLWVIVGISSRSFLWDRQIEGQKNA